MATTLDSPMALLVPLPADLRLPSPGRAERRAVSQLEVDAALLEALTILLDDSTTDLFDEDEPRRYVSPRRARAAARNARAEILEWSLVERGGWDEV